MRFVALTGLPRRTVPPAEPSPTLKDGVRVDA